jgi:hypothetical protein
VNLGGPTAMAKGREIPFWRTFVGTFGFFFSSKCLGRIGFWQTLLFSVILLVVAEEILEYLAVLKDYFLNFFLILLECLILSPLAILIHRKILIDENISAEFTFTKKQYCIHSWPSYSHSTEYYS